MSGRAKTVNPSENHQLKPGELRKGYQPTGQIDLQNLKIPKNMGDAAVLPTNGTTGSAATEAHASGKK